MKQLKLKDLEEFIGKDMYVIVTDNKQVFRINNQFQYFAGFDTHAVQDHIYDLRSTLPSFAQNLTIMKYTIHDISSFTDLCTNDFYPFIRIVGYGDLPLQEIIKCRDDVVKMLTSYLQENILNGVPVFFLAGVNNTYIHETIDGIEMALSFYTTIKRAKSSMDLKPRVYSVYSRQLDKLKPYGFYSINSKLIYGIEIKSALAEARKQINQAISSEETKDESQNNN